MAAALGMSETAFLRQFAHRINGKWSLREQVGPGGMDCVFLTWDQDGRSGCSLYAARPGQCRTWPFWAENLVSPEAWEGTRLRTPCPGMGSGPIVSVDEIVARLGQQS
jgi:Fe-S-cluster containining protein